MIYFLSNVSWWAWKFFFEIIHAAGYEHPCQFHIVDIPINVDDTDLNRDLWATCKYQNKPVPFNSIMHLGGNTKNP